MSLKRLGAALLASLALAAVFASSAFATATTSNSHWRVAGTKLSSGETREIKCSKAGTENLVLAGTVAGAATEITATTLECPSGDVIKQEGEHGIATGTLKFSGLTVVKPAGCTTSASITTKALTAKIYMEGSTVYTRFEPTAGETSTFASIPLEGCAAEGTYPVKGTVFGKSSNATGVEAANQPLTFSAAINTTAGGSLLLGGNAASITGAANNELVSGSKFSSSETGEAVAVPVWSSTKNYLIGAKVEWKAGSTNCYQAKAATTGNQPPNGTYWNVVTC